jgi:hypothetical protein
MSFLGEGKLRIQADTIGLLGTNLGAYEATSILREQLQNADDACHEQGRRGELSLEFREDRMVVTNPSTFSDDDWDRLIQPNSRGKRRRSEQTGEFGLGFWGCLHLTDAPVVTSGEREATLNPEESSWRTVSAYKGTRIEFPYRRDPTSLSEELGASIVKPDMEERLVTVFVDQLSQLLLFTRAIETIRIVQPNGEVRRARRSVEPIADGIDRLSVSVEGAPEQSGQFIIVRSTVDDPPEWRHNRVAAALPLMERDRGPGRAFFTFPTETGTGIGFSIDGHFRASSDRRSLESSGDHGAWNDRIFAAAGRAVGEALETILQPSVHGLDMEDAYAWFAVEGYQLDDVARRTEILREALDEAALSRAVIPDRSMCFRRGDELVELPSEVEHLIGDVVTESVMPIQRASTREVFERWGVEQWGRLEVAGWLRRRLPHTRVPRQEAESFMQDEAAALELLEYCRQQAGQLRGVAVVLGSDDAFHPLAGELARSSSELAHLVDGLGVPVVHEGYMKSWVASLQPPTDADWLEAAVMGASDRLVGKQVPISDIACASSIDRVSETIGILLELGDGLEDIPLALDENRLLDRFDHLIVVGLPESPRKTSEALVRRLGLRPLHSKIDKDALRSAGRKFSVQLVVERIEGVHDWDPVDDSRLLVEVLAKVAKEGDTPRSLVDQLRERRMWAGTDGQVHTLSELRLPERADSLRSSLPLVAAELLGDVNPSSPIYATLKGLLRVDVLDSVEETVLACESAGSEPAELRALLKELGYHRDLSKSQQERLRHAAFVLCRDGRTRVPGDVILTSERLPLGLGDRSIDAEIVGDEHVCERLAELGAQRAPSSQDLVDCATEIAGMPIARDRADDPGRLLWLLLRDAHDRYDESTMHNLAEIAWVGTTTGERRRPCDCVDPRITFAPPLFPVPYGESTSGLPQKFRDSLRIRSTLTTAEYVLIGERSAQQGHRLPGLYFTELNRCCGGGTENLAMIAGLKSVSIIPTGDEESKELMAPQRFVSRSRKYLWGHLRVSIKVEFAASYPKLMAAWGISDDADVTWRDHLAVLSELLEADGDEVRNRNLAVARLRNLAESDLDENQLRDVFVEGAVPTSQGLVSFAKSLRPDLPLDIVERLRKHLPIIDESSEIIGLLERLPLERLSARVRLNPIPEDSRTDKVWPEKFRIHAANVIRFLRAAGTRVDFEQVNPWPPEVVSVRSLTVRALIDGVQIDEWPAEAHLASIEGPVLYVRGQVDSAEAVVDAIYAAYGFEGMKKSLLEKLLGCESADEGKRCLDRNDVPDSSLPEQPSDDVDDVVDIILPEQPDAELTQPDVPPSDRASVPATSGSDAGSSAGSRQQFEGDASSASKDERSGATSASSDGDRESSNDAAEAIEEPQHEPWRRGLVRPSSLPGVTDYAALEKLGFTWVSDLDEETPLEDYVPSSRGLSQPDEHRAVLSFVDVRDGLVPIPRNLLQYLTSGVSLQGVVLFGEHIGARKFDDTRIEIAGGAEIYQERLIVPGTIVWLHPSSPGKVEVEVRQDPHRVDGVWMLELDEEGNLSRIVQDDLELHWETDDAFYRAERRLEDIEALMADVGKSALQLVIEVFRARPGEGLTSDQVWGLVAISRLFAVATIKRILADQTGLFEQRGGLWYLHGNEIRKARRPQRGERRSTASAIGQGRPDPTGERGSTASAMGQGRPDPTEEALKVARQLVLLLSAADDATLRKIASILSLPKRISDVQFGEACRRYVHEGGEELLSAIERDIVGDPELAMVAIEELEDVSVPVLEQRRPLLELLLRHGTAGVVLRAKEIASRLVPFDGSTDEDPLASAQNALEAFKEARATKSQLIDALARLWEQPLGDPLNDPGRVLSALLDREKVHRSVSQELGDLGRAREARASKLGDLNWKMPEEIYDERDRQLLRVALDHMVEVPPEQVLSGLRVLADRAAATPGGGLDARLLDALVRFEEERMKVTPLKDAARRGNRLAGSSSAGAKYTVWDFVSNQWWDLVGYPPNDFNRYWRGS